MKAVDARPVKKVAEAKARKRKRLQVGSALQRPPAAEPLGITDHVLQSCSKGSPCRAAFRPIMHNSFTVAICQSITFALTCCLLLHASKVRSSKIVLARVGHEVLAHKVILLSR